MSAAVTPAFFADTGADGDGVSRRSRLACRTPTSAGTCYVADGGQVGDHCGTPAVLQCMEDTQGCRNARGPHDWETESRVALVDGA
ncbi:unnamed protein product [Phytophthora fragariaefolia]|uniref:Unnamed protein product n=1 Tax=Phytophthora fragariaefolia TaxID=1490495 RepID=A0A9W6YMI6_9STRA|nr:unnamed protein product [Phytophthora fragariaefolia]